jgi:hypothetical protein
MVVTAARNLDARPATLQAFCAFSNRSAHAVIRAWRMTAWVVCSRRGARVPTQLGQHDLGQVCLGRELVVGPAPPAQVRNHLLPASAASSRRRTLSASTAVMSSAIDATSATASSLAQGWHECRPAQFTDRSPLRANAPKVTRVTNDFTNSLKQAQDALRQAARVAYSREGQPALRLSNVAFVDLLGASELMQTLDDAGLRRVLHALRDNVDFFDFFDAYEGPARVVTFSDNIVACLPTDPTELDGGLAWHVISAGQFQRNLAFVGYFVRGGITVGPVYADESAVIGSGLVRAHDLELGAVHPRIVLDPAVVTLFASAFVADHDRYRSLQNQIVVVDTHDDCCFVHYLEFAQEADDREEMFEFMARHRDHISKSLWDASLPQKVHDKYRWVAQYHNWYCAMLDLPQFIVDKVSVPEGRFVPLLEWMESRGVNLDAAHEAWVAGARTVSAMGLPATVGPATKP